MFFSVLLLTTAYGLIRLSRWARYGVIVILWLLIIVVPIGVINPFFASDLAASGTEAPPVEILLAIIAPFVIWGVFCLHILGKYKTKFV